MKPAGYADSEIAMRIRARFVCASFLLAGLGPVLLGQAPSKPASPLPSATKQQPASARTSISAPAQTAATPPSSSSAPAETAATPPQVTFHDGLLGIHAENSTLGDVLKAVQSATGASVDSPGFASERVYVELGPGEPRDILAALLNGSPYDYIMIGSQEQPNSVARIMLTVRSTSIEKPTTAAAARPTPPPTPAPKEEEHDNSDVTPPDREPPAAAKPGQPHPGQPPTPNTTLGTTPNMTPGAVQQQPGYQPFGQPQQPVKTPEQMLRDLQQMQQQQQQQLQLQQQLQQQNNFSR